MKIKLLIAAMIVFAFHANAQAPAPGTTNSATGTAGSAGADADWDGVMKIWNEQPSKPREELGVRGFVEWQDNHVKRYSDAVVDFATKHPEDGRRWEGIVQMGFTTPFFLKGFKPEFDADPSVANLIVDDDALAKFKERQTRLLADVLEAPDSNVRQRTGAFGWLMTETARKTSQDSKPPDFSSMQPLVERVMTKFPDERGSSIAGNYLIILEEGAPDQAEAFQKKVDASPVAAAVHEMQKQAKEAGEAADREALAHVGDIGAIQFTAADGRVVDIAKLRGKVVLVDFWATWCGPCIRELPNVAANYKKYHDKGFEIVGISLENANIGDGDSTEAKEKKLETTKQKMLSFAKKNDMTWPQYYDGKYWQNDLALKYGVRAIPAAFLIDKVGKVVTTQATGAKLEAKLKALLEL